MGAENLDVIVHFRRRLATRLFLAAILLAALAGGIAFLVETETLDEALVSRAQREAERLDGLARIGVDGVEAQLRRLITERSSAGEDFFVLAEIYDAQRTSVAEVKLPESNYDRSSHDFPNLGETWYRKSLIDGDLYLQVMVPLWLGKAEVAGNAPAGWFEGIYRISPATVAGIRETTLGVTALVVLSVLMTALILYPLMMSLQRHIVDKARDLLDANLGTLKVLGDAIAKRDSDTNVHNYRVTLYAAAIAQKLGCNDGEIRELIKGSFLHDLGKIAIPDAILLKPGKLDNAEFETMKTHVVHGLDIIAQGSWLAGAVSVVGGHHEKVDGSGYPLGLKGEEIPLAARIFAIADVFDALSSERPYKPPFPLDRTLSILEEGRDSHFDGRVLDAAFAVLPQIRHDLEGLETQAVEDRADHLLARYFPIG
ncbi:HD-GYP domain-containing protein [Rhodospirillum sp. A1_3_36]|uniref:HD-GYP domain-containing protein n=1 Tax=Rhodospirillum sp. A1_3_36 TaxID=3391666 RepID=UPI0039A71736